MTPQEAAEQYIKSELKIRICESPSVRDGMESDFLAGQQWQSEQDNQALSSALKEIAELTSWKNEMLQLWNKLDAYLQTRNDIRVGESKIDFAIKVMRERDCLHAKIKELENKPNNFM